MKLTFANSAFIKAPTRVILRGGAWARVLLRVRFGVLEHPQIGPILVDTGYSNDITHHPDRSIALRAYAAALKPDLQEDGECTQVLQRLGYTPKDVQTIIVTHFHADHVAGLKYFPKAQIITNGSVLKPVLNQGTFANLRHGVFGELVPTDLMGRTTDIATLPEIAAPLGLGSGRDLFGDGQVIAVDLPGHAHGHFGLCFPAFKTPLLYACDVQWMLAALKPSSHSPLLAKIVSHDRAAAVQSSARVAAFRAAGGTVVLCHEPERSDFDLKQAVR